MGILFGMIAALCWGTGDFLITLVTRRVGTGRAMVYIQALSLASWIALLVLQPSVPHVELYVWGVAILAGVCHVLGLVLTYRAFEIGKLSLVSPIASSFAVITALLALLTGSEQPPLLALSGSVLLIAGTVLATRGPSTKRAVTLVGVPEAIGSALAFGTMFWMFDVFVSPRLGFVWPLIILKTMAVGSALISMIAQPSVATTSGSTGATAGVPTILNSALSTLGGAQSWQLWLLVLGAVITDVSAWLAWVSGTSTEYATVVTALASLFSVVTILLAWKLLREYLTPSQWSGIAVILLGILLVSI